MSNEYQMNGNPGGVTTSGGGFLSAQPKTVVSDAQASFRSSEISAQNAAESPLSTSQSDFRTSELNAQKERPGGFKVKLEGPNGAVVFQASVPVSESRSAAYDSYAITHMPTTIWAYRSTSSRKFSIPGKLVSRNANEAVVNSQYLNLIRSWILPDFGGTGAPPPIIKFSAFHNDNIDQVRCIILSYSFTFPDDVDFIYDANNPMPVIGTLSIELEEVYSADEITAGAWMLNNVVSPSEFAGQAESTSSEKSGLALAAGPGFKGLANASSLKNGITTSLGSTVGTIAGALAGKKLFGNMAGAAAGALGGALLGSSPLLKDVLNGASKVVNNVFQTGISQASAASNNIIQSFQKLGGPKNITTTTDQFARDTNPPPPPMADL